LLELLIYAAWGNPRAHSRGQWPDAGEHFVAHTRRCAARDQSRPGAIGEFQRDSESLGVCSS
jgi:hypothetical protein